MTGVHESGDVDSDNDYGNDRNMCLHPWNMFGDLTRESASNALQNATNEVVRRSFEMVSSGSGANTDQHYMPDHSTWAICNKVQNGLDMEALPHTVMLPVNGHWHSTMTSALQNLTVHDLSSMKMGETVSHRMIDSFMSALALHQLARCKIARCCALHPTP